jgi:hypothetical protein
VRGSFRSGVSYVAGMDAALIESHRETLKQLPHVASPESKERYGVATVAFCYSCDRV